MLLGVAYLTLYRLNVDTQFLSTLELVELDLYHAGVGMLLEPLSLELSQRKRKPLKPWMMELTMS